MNYRLKKISGDASFREFYRVERKNKTSVIVFARKEQYKNLIVYSVVNKILTNHNILSPKLIKNYYKHNMIEITDLGDKSFYDYIKNKNELNQLGIFKDDKYTIKIIEWPELVETSLTNRLDLHLKHSDQKNERELNLIGHGKWKNINENEL